jgi:hypothetical protein
VGEEVRAEYDWAQAVRGKDVKRYRRGVRIRVAQPDLCAFFVSLGMRWGFRTKTHSGIPVRRPRVMRGALGT